MLQAGLRRNVDLSTLAKWLAPWICTLCLIASGSCLPKPPMLFAYIPIDANASLGGRSLTVDLLLDIYVMFAPPARLGDKSRNDALGLARWSTEQGIRVFLVVGNDVNTSDASKLYDQVNDDISFFAHDIDGLILWDDPIKEGYIPTRNIVANWVRGNWSQFEIGLGLDPPSRNASLHSQYYADLGLLDTKPYDFVVTYCFCQINASRSDELELLSQGTDPGETARLRDWVVRIKSLSQKWGLQVWFTLSAHQEGNLSGTDYLTTTTDQMSSDLEVVKDGGFWAIGWFTMNRQDRAKWWDTRFVGAIDAGRYSWAIYSHLKTDLLDSAKQPTIAQLLGEIQALQEELEQLRGVGTQIDALENNFTLLRVDIAQRLDEAAYADRNQTQTLRDLKDELESLRVLFSTLEGELAVVTDRTGQLKAQVSLLGGALVLVVIVTSLTPFLLRRHGSPNKREGNDG